MKSYLFLVLLTLACFACNKNTNPPEYIKEVVAYKEGSDGIVVYFVLADKDGQPTSASGPMSYHIESKRPITNGYGPLLSDTKTIKAEDFKEADVGVGALQHKVLVYSLGRFMYKDFGSPLPWDKDPDSFSKNGRVRVDFTTESGKFIQGEGEVMY